MTTLKGLPTPKEFAEYVVSRFNNPPLDDFQPTFVHVRNNEYEKVLSVSSYLNCEECGSIYTRSKSKDEVSITTLTYLYNSIYDSLKSKNIIKTYVLFNMEVIFFVFDEFELKIKRVLYTTETKLSRSFEYGIVIISANNSFDIKKLYRSLYTKNYKMYLRNGEISIFPFTNLHDISAILEKINV